VTLDLLERVDRQESILRGQNVSYGDERPILPVLPSTHASGYSPVMGNGNALDRFGPFTFDRQRMVVTKDEEAVPLGGREAALLGALLDARGKAVEITTLRKALRQKPDGTDWIVTVRHLGYRLVAGESTGGSEAGRRRPTGNRRPSVRQSQQRSLDREAVVAVASE
jgi:DNA-binding winged helix-turn-helix (wHTH) protein